MSAHGGPLSLMGAVAEADGPAFGSVEVPEVPDVPELGAGDALGVGDTAYAGLPLGVPRTSTLKVTWMGVTTPFEFVGIEIAR